MVSFYRTTRQAARNCTQSEIKYKRGYLYEKANRVERAEF